jgi:hypothetical protein
MQDVATLQLSLSPVQGLTGGGLYGVHLPVLLSQEGFSEGHRQLSKILQLSSLPVQYGTVDDLGEHLPLLSQEVPDGHMQDVATLQLSLSPMQYGTVGGVVHLPLLSQEVPDGHEQIDLSVHF